MLRSWDVADLEALFEYQWESDEPGPMYWRGGEKRPPIGLSDLLVIEKVDDRIEAALIWKRTRHDPTTLVLGPTGSFRSPGTAQTQPIPSWLTVG